jgi:hypothetical protein
MASRRIAFALGATLIALAAFVAWAAAHLEDQPASQSIDPQHTGVATAGGFAACFCIVALWTLRKASRGRGWLAASIWLALATIALFVVVLVAVASRLGG